MNESVVTFGQDGIRVGVITESSLPAAASRPTVLILNAGIVHKVGPYRQTVDLARKLSRMGFEVLRFDLSGLGDSDKRKDTRSDEERAVADILEAMDFMATTRNSKRFLLMGLCSGADNAHPVAVRDPRVVGGVFLDGFGYETPGFYFRKYWRKVTDPARWLNLARRGGRAFLRLLIALKLRRAGPGELQQKTKTYVREFPPKEKIQEELRQLVARDMQMLYIFTDGVARYLNYRGQFRDMFPGLDWKTNIEVDFFPAADHTYTLLPHREWLFARILNWSKRFT